MEKDNACKRVWRSGGTWNRATDGKSDLSIFDRRKYQKDLIVRRNGRKGTGMEVRKERERRTD
jgi:hypothetical protein